MKIGIISDIHGNYDALSTVLDVLKKENVDLIVNAGDNVGYSPFPDECVRMLKDASVEGVRGNYDEAVGYDRESCGCGDCCETVEQIRRASLKWTQGQVSEETREYLRALPHYRMIGTGNGKILIMHGGLDKINELISPDDEDKLMEISIRTDARLIVLGHTHQAFSRTVNGTMFVNPGSVGKPVDGDPRASYAVANMGNGVNVRLSRTVYPVEHNIRALEEAGLPRAIGDMLRKGRSDSLA
ncbi:MAG TPA: metallophosphoesterase family protein [Methanocella sp.]|nr:metallophosphoesterase family protein [Methanocella sp.]